MDEKDFHSQVGRTSPPGLSSQLCRENKSSGQNCVVNIELVRIGGRFPPTGRENKSSGPFLAVMSGEQVLRAKLCSKHRTTCEVEGVC